MSSALFADDFRGEPYWWDTQARPAYPREPLPAKVDVLVVGSGYTGLMAARATALAGRSTLVLDAGKLGFGCSTRNGGQVSTSIKPGFAELAGRFGTRTAFAIRREGFNALEFISELIRRQQLNCAWERNGRFHGAHNRRQYELLARELQNQPRGLEVPYHMVPRAEQAREIGSDFYHGGVVYPHHALLDPVRFHAELLRLADEAGATLVGDCEVHGIVRQSPGFGVHTRLGEVRARDLVLATNGYTGALSPWQRRRVIPIPSCIIATAELPLSLAAQLLPANRAVTDTRKLVCYYRLSPDRRRVLFGGRVAAGEIHPRRAALSLHQEMTRIFPQLQTTRITHGWMGQVAFSFDSLPHIGCHEGIWYAMAYCGSGVSLATYLGHRLGQQVLGLEEGKTALDGLPFATRPLYKGNPWFLAPAIAWYRLRDSLPV